MKVGEHMRINFYNQDNELLFWADISINDRTEKMIKKGYIEVFNLEEQCFTRLYFKKYARVDFKENNNE